MSVCRTTETALEDIKVVEEVEAVVEE